MARPPLALVFGGYPSLYQEVREVMGPANVAEAEDGSISLSFAPGALDTAVQALRLLEDRIVELDGESVRIIRVETWGLLVYDTCGEGRCASCAYKAPWDDIRSVYVPGRYTCPQNKG